jgi:hypothetical protein
MCGAANNRRRNHRCSRRLEAAAPSAERATIVWMAVARNARCPCGSALKYKRCCGSRDHDRLAKTHREERVARQAEEWAFAHHREELVPAGRRLIASLAHSSQAAWIAEHWVMLDHELRRGATAAAAYAALPDLYPDDRATAARIATSRVALLRVVACRPGVGMDLHDVLRRSDLSVSSAGISTAANAGDLLVGRVMDGTPASLWGPAAVFDPRRAAVLLDRIAELGRLDEPTLRSHWPALMTIDATTPAVVARLEWDHADGDEVFDDLPDALEYDRCEDGVDILLWRIGPGAATTAGSSRSTATA